MRKKISLFILIAVILVPALSVLSGAAGESGDSIAAYSLDGYSMYDTSPFVPAEDEEGAYLFPDLSQDDKWSCGGTYSDSYYHSGEGVVYYCANIKEESMNSHQTGSVTFTLDLSDEEKDISGYSVMKFALAIRGGSSEGRGFFVRTNISTSDGTYPAHFTALSTSSASGLTLCCIDTSSVTGTVRNVRVTVYFNAGKRPSHIRISSPFLAEESDGSFDFALRYMTAGFETKDCGFDALTGEIITGDDGDAVLRGNYAGNYVNCNGKAFIVCALSGASGGSVAVSLRYCESETGKLIELSSPRVSLHDDLHEYAFPFGVTGSVVSYSVILSDVGSDDKVTLDGVRLLEGSVSAFEKGFGSVSSIERNGNHIRFAGTVERNAVKEYEDSRIAFFAVPVNGEYSEPVRIGEINITTKFQYTADISSCAADAGTYMFMAAIATDNGEVIPLSPPRYYDAGDVSRSKLSSLGLHGTASVGAFESNASHMMIDIPLDELFDAQGRKTATLSYTVYGVSEGDKPYSTRTVRLDRELLESIDGDVNFCISAGIKVYFRFVSSTPIEGLTFSADGCDNYAVSPKGAEGRSLYAALVDYLVGRYRGIDGFVIGTDASRMNTTGNDSFAYPVQYAETLAEVCRLTYNAVSEYDEDIITVIPVSRGGDIACETLSVLLADSLREIGNVPWAMMYCTGSTAESTQPLYSSESVMTELLSEGFFEKMIFCELNEDEIRDSGSEDGDSAENAANLIGRMCDYNSEADVIFFSLGKTGLRNDSYFYSDLKKTVGEGYVFEARASDEVKESYGTYTLWDFSDKYYSLGWRAVGVSSFMSDCGMLGGYDAGRVLRAVFDGEESGASGIMLCNFDSTVDLTKADGITFTFALGGDRPDALATVVFVTGTDDVRAEYYTALMTDGEEHTLCCDLSGFDGRDVTDYVGIMVYADCGVELELKKAELTSPTLDEDGIAGLFAPTEEMKTGENGSDTLWLEIGGIAVMTVVIFLLIVRREKESAENKNRSGKETGRKQ